MRRRSRRAGAFPLVIISHGYPGNRYLLSHLGENLASKGFVVASIDHKDSTYDDQQNFASTLYNRPFDQLFVLNEMARLGKPGSGSFLSGIVDADRTGPRRLLDGRLRRGERHWRRLHRGERRRPQRAAERPARRARRRESRVSARPWIRASRPRSPIAPWGMQGGYWDADGLKGIRTPVLFVAGSADSVAGYEDGTKAIFQEAVNADRYLLTFLNASHNAARRFPRRSKRTDSTSAYSHYADAVWDNTRMNNILDHFATAYFGLYLRGEQDKQAYFDPNWKGFKPRAGRRA